MKKTNILWIIAIISIFLLPNVLAACEGLQYDQCNGGCKPAGNFYYNTLQNSNQADCVYFPVCAQGDIFVSGTWVENLFCCNDNQVGCPPAQSSSYTGYSEVYCLNNYNCVSNCTVGLDVCEIGGQQQCVNLQTSNSNCGACGNACSSEQTCDNGVCVTDYTPLCPNGIIDAGEECDDNNYTYNDECTQDCKNAFCGDGFIRTQGANPEQCDGINFADATCGSLTGKFSGDLSCDGTTCTIDTSGCYAQCGNGVCETSVGESDANCVADCGLYGWHTNDLGWAKNNENRLVGTTSGNATDIYSDPFELRTNSTYVLSVGFIQSNCEAYVDLNDGKCLSRTNWLEQNCFTDKKLTSPGFVQINTTVTSNHASQGFFKNVSVRIHVPANCVATFDDISFKEKSPINPSHDYQPDINLTTACCPKEYCWTGSMCVMPTNWANSTYSNLWDNLDIYSLTDNHVMSYDQAFARGYRCVLNESEQGEWVPAQVKYDWNFRESGYCAKETDCFVGNNYYNETGNGDQCIRNGQFINDANIPELNKGNHYCMNGEWTTKTYLIANVLENLTVGKPYIIFCDDTGRIFNNLGETQAPSPSENKISGGCVLISKDANREKIISGFYVETPYQDMICQWYMGFYNIMHPEMPIEQCPQGFGDEFCISVNPPFSRCVQATDFNLYKNTESLYYLLSNDPITVIDEGFFQQIWNSIINFFQRLFGYTPEEPLGLANQTTNYDRIYVLSNHSMNVSAIEETKYDEELTELMVYMYLNMTSPGISQENNPLNIEFINKSLGGVYYKFDQSPNSQAIVIKYNQPAELWSYLTAMLRDRP